MVILVPSAIGDYRQQRVPNWLSMPGWVVAPIIAWLCMGFDGTVDSLFGLGLMLSLFIPLWMTGWFGAADVKLMGTVGAFVSINDAWVVLFGVLITGMIMAILMLVYARSRRILARSQENRSDEMERCANTKKKGIVLPYAIPIAFGTMLSILYLKIY
jgi:prepilin peptidase CpaA